MGSCLADEGLARDEVSAPAALMGNFSLSTPRTVGAGFFIKEIIEFLKTPSSEGALTGEPQARKPYFMEAFVMQGKNKITVKAIAGCAMLAAISIVMARLLCFATPDGVR